MSFFISEHNYFFFDLPIFLKYVVKFPQNTWDKILYVFFI
jgi:hypothetical protein